MIAGNSGATMDHDSSTWITSTKIGQNIGEKLRATGMTEDKAETELCVAFTTIEIKEYPIIIGDNPSVTKGVPVTIAWTPVETRRCTVDTYEKKIPSPRSMKELKMPSSYRVDPMQRPGFTSDEILRGTKAANITRNCRRRTSETMTIAPAQEVFERMIRAMVNATVRRMAKKSERRIVGNFLPMHVKYIHALMIEVSLT